MSQNSITMVRIYLTEGDHQLKALLAYLHDVEEVAGVTAFRGIAGFGQSGKMHTSDLLDLSLDMPLVVEFFDEQQKVERVLQHLDNMIEPGHIVSWPANLR